MNYTLELTLDNQEKTNLGSHSEMLTKLFNMPYKLMKKCGFYRTKQEFNDFNSLAYQWICVAKDSNEGEQTYYLEHEDIMATIAYTNKVITDNQEEFDIDVKKYAISLVNILITQRMEQSSLAR